MYDILANRLHSLVLFPGVNTLHQNLAFLAELDNLGFKTENPQAILKNGISPHSESLNLCKKMKGANVDYVPLFSDFPNIPDDDQYLFRRILGFFGVSSDLLFNKSMFGADPVTQFQTWQSYKEGKERQALKTGDSHKEYTSLKFVDQKEAEELLSKWVANCLYAKSPIKEILHKDIEYLVLMGYTDKIDINKVVLKENRTFLFKVLWNLERYDELSKYVTDATDILRLFAVLTNGDISLASKIRFPKLNRKQRKAVLSIIDNIHSLDSFVKYKDLWKTLGRYIHPGEYSTLYPRAYNIFNQLRNGKIVTYMSAVENHISSGDYNSLIDLLKDRPTLFARRLHEILVKFPEKSLLTITAFVQNIDKIPSPVLWTLYSYFKTINFRETKDVVNKLGKMKVIKNKYYGLVNQRILDILLKNIYHAILNRPVSLPISGNVWIDPSLEQYTIPFQQRKMSEGLFTVGRGSRIKIDTSKVIRCFIYWKQASQRTDLDLSVQFLDKDFNPCGHVSYTNLQSTGVVHSGDIQSAPHGAAEFIDIDIDKIPRQTKYISMCVYKYRGEDFDSCETCYAGVMVRDNVTGKAFDAGAVKNKLNVTGKSSYNIPLVIDLECHEVVYCDLSSSHNRIYPNIERTGKDIATLVSVLCDYTKYKPTLYGLMYAIALQKNCRIVDKESADYTIGIEECDLNVYECERILSECL